uniref:Serine aminopeptidase S33 domain-containing protein n=1 Tax=Globisporangium ultimum (strain ATCC 200006 / CBS 805.95 / DAOM BR144) TaxID=431595 RepID=K3X1E7_GLOUD
MALVLPPFLATLVERLKSRYRVLAPLTLLALFRYVYHRRQRHLEQLRVHRAINQELTHARHVVHHPHGARVPALAAAAAGEIQFHPDLLSPVEEWHDVAEGVQTQSIVYHALPDANGVVDSDVLVLIVPGNPGIAHFYLPLMREIVARHGRRHEVRSISNAGHFMPWKNNGREFTFQEQIEHKLNYVGQRVAQNPNLKLIVIGHSIGGYITLKIAERYPEHVAKLCLMQPTIMHMMKTTKGAALAPVFEQYKHAIKLVHMLEFLCPTVVRQFFIRLAIGHTTEDVLQHATLSLVNRHVMRNVLLMALHEMQQVCELDDSLVRTHEDKTLFVYSPIDDWVPNEFVQGYQERFTKSRHRMIPQSHGFMMDVNGTRDMAAHISQWISDVVDGDAYSALPHKV